MATQVRSWTGARDEAVLLLINQERSGHSLAGEVNCNDNVDLRTRDLLGGSLHKEIDLDVAPPTPLLSLSGWEKRLDMKTGKVYFHNGNSTESLQDLNFPPPSPARGRANVSPNVQWGSRLTRAAADEGAERSRPLEEHDFMGGGGVGGGDAETSASLPAEGPEWQSVCTLDKVKTALALQRARTQTTKRKHAEESLLQCRSLSSPPPSPSPPLPLHLPSSSSSSSVALSISNQQSESTEEVTEGPNSTSLMAAGCPRCLLYVLFPKCDPKCPRCGCSIQNTSTASPSLHSSSSGPKRPRLYDIEGQAGITATATNGSCNTLPPFLFDLNTPT